MFRTLVVLISCVVICGAAWSAEPTREEIAAKVAPILHSPTIDGLLVFQVMPKSQAERAGIRIGDVITHYDGQAVMSLAELVQLARSAAREQRNGLLVLMRRGKDELDAELDAAPIGVRLVPIKKGKGRMLWRPGRDYKPDFAGLARALQYRHRWELVYHDDEIIGWAHAYLARRADHFVLRVQSRIVEEHLNAKRDAIVAFDANPYLSLRALQLVSNDKTIMTVHRSGGRLVGQRAGAAVGDVPIHADTVCAYLSGYVAAAMPAEPGACLRCSFLADSSLTPAPFADLFCHGKENVTIAGEKLPTVRYEQTVFGDTVAEYWIDPSRDIVQVRYGNGIRTVRSTQQELFQRFPKLHEEFGPIDELPPLQTQPLLEAN